jgi:phenylpyruvate tautomerase PptA (4-oxalocrotonate tautomerase family)
VIIQIFLSRGRTVEKKQALYRSIVERLHAFAGVRKEDVMIVLTEVGTEDWSFGLGEAQYVLNPPKK